MVYLSVEALGHMTQNFLSFFLRFLTASFFTNSVFLSFSFIFALSSASLINCIDLGLVR